MARVNRITREAAEALGIQALAYLAGDPERLGRFLALSGLGPETIRAAAHDPGFLAGVYPAWRICTMPPALQLKLQ